MVGDFVVWMRSQWDRIAGSVLIGAGAVLVFMTYERVADTPLVAKQLSYLASGGLGGLLAAAVGVLLRLEADLRDEWHKLDRIEVALTEQRDAPVYVVLADAESPDDHLSDGATAAPARRPSTALTIGMVGFFAAVALLTVGYERAAGTGDIDRAFGGLVIGIVGLLVASLMVGGYHLVNRRWLGERKSRLLGRWIEPPTARPEPAESVVPGIVAVVPGGTRYHLGGCPSLASVTARFLPRTTVDAELQPCQICGAP